MVSMCGSGQFRARPLFLIESYVGKDVKNLVLGHPGSNEFRGAIVSGEVKTKYSVAVLDRSLNAMSYSSIHLSRYQMFELTSLPEETSGKMRRCLHISMGMQFGHPHSCTLKQGLGCTPIGIHTSYAA